MSDKFSNELTPDQLDKIAGGVSSYSSSSTSSSTPGRTSSSTTSQGSVNSSKKGGPAPNNSVNRPTFDSF